ncbi:MAG: microcystin degradation protein MlrC [Planctomycetaceae bacterium]|nr:microcystin degradation protein MlrC [Planctomycetaceae bacterium]
MPRIVIAECKQEVSTFNPSPSHYEDFRIVRGPAMVDYHRGGGEEVAGAISVLDADPSVQIVPSFGASAITSGGVLSAAGFQRLSSEILGSLAEAGPVDAAFFSLHGAMQAESEDDPEGYLLREARRILGERIPFVVSLDLHGILTDRMLEHSDAVVCYHTYPHVDFFQTGARAAGLLLKILKGHARPVTARVKIPALVRGDELITDKGSIRECIQLSQQLEASEKGLSAGVMWGNPFTDVPELRTNSIVCMDGDEAAAREQALELARRFWKHHSKMQVPLTSLTESVRQAAEIKSGTVVMMDAADATSSGASGDSNAILGELIRQGYRGTALIPIVDPTAVRQAFEAGVGATIQVSVGGAFDPARFPPVKLEAQVRMLSDGKFRSESFGWKWDSGKTAVLQSGNYTLVVGTRPVSLFDRSWFFANGQDPKRFNLVVVKSPHCEHHMFADWCAKLINVDAPGSTSANVRGLGHTRCARPMFPLDGEIEFHPAADIFRRW